MIVLQNYYSRWITEDFVYVKVHKIALLLVPDMLSYNFFLGFVLIWLYYYLIPRPKLVLELLNWLLKFFLCNLEVLIDNFRHNNCVIFSIFLYFKYNFLSNSFICKFVHVIIFLFIKRKAISCLSVELPKMYQYWSCSIIL